MKRILVLLITVLFFFMTHVGAQTNQTDTIDSLKSLLSKAKQDTTRVLLLEKLNQLYILSKPDSAIIMALEGLRIARRIGFLKGEAISLHRMGTIYYSFNRPKGMELLLQSIKINEKINNQDGLINNYNAIVMAYNALGDYRTALKYAFQAKALSEGNNNKRGLSLALLRLAGTYGLSGILDSSKFFAQQSHELATQINAHRTMGYSLNTLGASHLESGQNKLALEYFRLGAPELYKAGDLLGVSGSFLGMAKVFDKTAQIDSTLFYARKSLWVTKESRRLPNIDVSNFLYSIYKKKGNTDSALLYMEMAKTINDSLLSQEKVQQLQSLAFDEKLRQQEKASAELKVKQEREINLQYAAIVVGLIIFIILFVLVSQTIIVRQKFIEFLSILGLLALFEFLNLFMHPYLAHATNDSPLLMLAIMVMIAALLIPAHHKLEKWITKIMVEKNKKIRLEAAKNTIANLEPAVTEATSGKTE